MYSFKAFIRRIFFVFSLIMGLWLGETFPVHAFDQDFLESLEPKKGNYKVSVWNNTNGIPHNTIYALEKDHFGYIWMATEEGLSRFDGSTVKVFDKDSNPDLLESAYYYFTPVPGKGIWAVGDQSLVFLDKNIKKIIDCKSIVKDSWITSLAEDEKGKLWIGTRDGKIFSYEEEQFEPLQAWENLDNHPIQSIFAKKDQLLIGTDAGLFSYEMASGKLLPLNSGPLATRIILASGNRILIGAQDSGIWELGKDNELSLLVPKNLLSTIDYRSLKTDQKGRIWAGTEKGELLMIVGKNVKTLQFPEIFDHPIRKLLMDDNIFFVGTQSKGLMIFKESLIRNFEHPALSNRNIRPIYKSADGSLWIGTRNSGAFRIKEGITTTYDAKNGLVHEGIVSIWGDEANVYLGTRAGLYRVNLTSNTINEDFHLSQGFPRHQINTIIRDKKGNIWIGAGNRGIFFIEPNQKIKQLKLPESFENMNFISAALLNNGDLAFGTITSGMLILRDGKVLRHVDFDAIPGEKVIYQIHEDPDGDLWIGTQAGLLFEKDNTFVGIKKEQGLIGNGIYSITPDHLGNIWLSSNFGIQKVPASELSRLKKEGPKGFFLAGEIFNDKHGMKNLETNSRISPASLKLDNGEIWIPTIEGISIIEPERFNKRIINSTFIWDQLKIGNSLTNIEGPLKISAGTSNFSITFSVIDFEDDSQSTYFYRIKGFSEEWIYLGSLKEIFFNLLPPSSYTLEIKKLEAGVETGIYRLNFEVLPYFYQTWWFMVLLGLTALFWVVFIISYYFKNRLGIKLTSMVQQRTMELEEANQRLEIAIKDIETQNKRLRDTIWHQSHIVRGPLARAMAIIQLLRNFETYGDETIDKDELLKVVDKSLHDLDEIVRNINDELQRQKGKLE